MGHDVNLPDRTLGRSQLLLITSLEHGDRKEVSTSKTQQQKQKQQVDDPKRAAKVGIECEIRRGITSSMKWWMGVDCV